jgi:hypothetical protein
MTKNISMKKIMLLFLAATLSIAGVAQKGKGHGKIKVKTDKQKVKTDKQKLKVKEKVRDDDDRMNGRSKVKLRPNLPAPVSAAFLRDYPGATNVTWSKDRGDWTATFNGGTSARYHANGDRKETRSSITRAQLPGSIWDGVFVRDNVVPSGPIVQIQPSGTASTIFQIATQPAGGQVQYVYYDVNGNRVQYSY